MFYSKTTGGFYDPEIHGANIPADAVEITCEQHCALLEGQAKGQVIVCNESGHPCLEDHPAPSAEVLLDACKAEAKKRLEDTDFSQLPDVVDAISNKAAFDAYRAALRVIYFNPVTAPEWPERPVAVWI